jgi:hypothetical protein
LFEEDMFDGGPDGKARGFTKVVRQSMPGQFRSCVIRWQKTASPR